MKNNVEEELKLKRLEVKLRIEVLKRMKLRRIKEVKLRRIEVLRRR